MKYLLTIVLLFTLSKGVTAENNNFLFKAYVTSDSLLVMCEEENNPVCEAYIVGVFDAAQGESFIGDKYCIPDSAKADQLKRVVTKYLQNHFESLHLPAVFNIYAAFIESFPCE